MDMKKKITNICLGVITMCSLLLPNVPVKATEIASATSAVIDIEKYEVIEGNLNPGEQITLKLQVKNNSEVSNAENTVLTFEAYNGTLAPVYGDDNQIYIGTVAAGQTVNVVVDAVVNKQFNLDSVQLKCYFNYVSGAAPLRNEVAINIPTNVAGNLIAESTVVAENATMGVNSLVSIRCKNAGNTVIDDAKLVITGNIQDGKKEILLSSITAGKTLAEDYYVNFAKVGIQNLHIEYQYTDAQGQKCIVDCGDYKVNVINNMDKAQNESVVEQVPGTSSVVLQVILLGAVVLMVAGVFVGYIKGRR